MPKPTSDQVEWSMLNFDHNMQISIIFYISIIYMPHQKVEIWRMVLVESQAAESWQHEKGCSSKEIWGVFKEDGTRGDDVIIEVVNISMIFLLFQGYLTKKPFIAYRSSLKIWSVVVTKSRKSKDTRRERKIES